MPFRWVCHEAALILILHANKDCRGQICVSHVTETSTPVIKLLQLSYDKTEEREVTNNLLIRTVILKNQGMYECVIW